ncbi:MAG: phosphonate ABC transporter, permease protein PhnE [Chloroflexi bacterium UTCFX4]|nr:MAG: phosphonate ABC transporter, permease protein PhnE [Chloroflexi bacterium UTCFX4]
MAQSANSSTTHLTKSPTLAALLSLVIPGAGQFYLGARNVALAIFVASGAFIFLIGFTLDNFRAGKIEIGGVETSWLWLLLIAFWLWNVWDAHQRARGKTTTRLFSLGIPILLIYIIAWQVTDPNFTRLVTRFSDVQIIFNALIHPDLLTRDTETQAGATTIWVPCSEPPQTAAPEGNSGLPVGVNKICGTVGDTLVMAGQGFHPNTTGNVYWLEYNGTNEVQIRAAGQPVLITTDADGKFTVSFEIPAFAGREGLDPTAPIAQGIQARFTQEVGPLKPSENFQVLVGSIAQDPAPGWMVSLGLRSPTDTVPRFVPGGIFVTIGLGLMATLISIIVAAPLSFFGARNVMARVRGGVIIYYIARGVFNIVRSIDTLIWAIILVTWTGLGAFTGLLALSIHSIASIAKLYSEEVEHTDPGPVEAVTATGGNLLQNIRFAVIPQIIPSFLAYSLLRWDINMRSATVVGFVSAAGIGFYIVESIRKGGYREYAAALWCIAIVVLIVDYLSAYWREQIVKNENKISTEPPKPFYKTRRGIFYTILFALVFVASWNLAQVDLGKLFEPAPTFVSVLSDFATVDLSIPVWEQITRQLLITIFQALLATTLGALVALPFAFLAAKNITGRSARTRWVYYGTRFILSFLRSIEAILYVSIFVFWVGIGAFAGMLALSITTFGLIGKLFSEAVENIEEGSVEALTATGANRLQSIAFAIVPQIVPPFISYAIYQWDINIRLATIIGLAGGGGIGQLFANYVGQLQYHKAGAVILSIVVIVTLMDLASAKIRERLV